MYPVLLLSDEMSPNNEEEEETSEFGSDTDIPMGQSLGNTQVRVEAEPAESRGNSKIMG